MPGKRIQVGRRNWSILPEQDGERSVTDRQREGGRGGKRWERSTSCRGLAADDGDDDSDADSDSDDNRITWNMKET